MGIRRIAHLTDLHLLGRRADSGRARADLRTRYLTIGRPLDAEGRAARFELALHAAQSAGADHIVISGDLTETGHPSEYEMVAECLAHRRVEAERMTIVPGNHDAYHSPTAFADALAGPLARWAKSAVSNLGHVVDLGAVWLLPIDVTRHQSVTRSSGVFTDLMRTSLRHRLLDAQRQGKAAVVVQHHPPYPRPHILQRIDGLHGWEMLWDALSVHEEAQVVFGHLHETVDGPLSSSGRGRRFLGAPAVVDGVRAPNLRVYDVGADGLVSSSAHGASPRAAEPAAFETT